jgi:hypothetical protein
MDTNRDRDRASDRDRDRDWDRDRDREGGRDRERDGARTGIRIGTVTGTGTRTGTGKGTGKVTGTGIRDRDMNKDPAEIYADWFDTPRKFVPMGIITRRNLSRGICRPTGLFMTPKNNIKRF